MKVHFDKVTDAIYLRLKDSEIVGSEEVHPGIILDFDQNNAVVAIEVLHVTARIDLQNLDQIDVEVA